MNMTCANNDCRVELKYLRGGRLFLMERQQTLPGFAGTLKPERTMTMRRYFWLCESCCQIYTIRRWTENGVELTARVKRVQPIAALPRDWNLPGLVG